MPMSVKKTELTQMLADAKPYANIRVYHNLPLPSGTTKIGEHEYIVNLNPGVDTEILGHTALEASDVSTMLAHELGHVIALIDAHPSHDLRYQRVFGPQPAEALAWRYAEQMHPNLDQQLKQVSLESYGITK